MGQTRQPDSVALIVGMLSMQQELFDLAARKMQALWGPIALQSAVMPFGATDYYTRQMGPALRRAFVAFDRLIDPGQLAAIKHQTNALENVLARGPAGRALGVARPINLDPGYVEPSKLVLATTKNYAHRVYIGKSMYAESTLRYHQGRWQGWPYTYPDYAGGAYDDFLTRVRDFLMHHRTPTPTTPAGPTTIFQLE